MAVQIRQINVNNNILDTQEQNLVESKQMTRYFGLSEDFIQLYVYTGTTNTLINTSPNFKDYTIVNNKEIVFDPEKNITDLGYRIGTYNLVYNFLRPIISLNPNLDLFIQNISTDRLEIKVSSTTESEDLIYSNAISYIDLVSNRGFFIEFYLDFGNNNLIPASSLAIERDVNNNTSILIKLFDALPSNIALNTPLNIVEEVVNTQAFEAILTTDPIVIPLPSLRQANFSIGVDDKRIGSTDYYNYNQITSLSGSNNPLQTLLSFVSSSNPTLNIDYTNYNNFIHFSSAVKRLETFKNKVTNLEIYNTYLKATASFTASNPDNIVYQTKINDIIQGFDGWENYMYYESSSYSWPKLNTVKPYSLYSYSSSNAITWYNINQTSASYYDEFNNDNLAYGLPMYLQERNDFEYIKPFVNSMGQMFDDIWVYIKAITDLWKSNNSLNDGISKDLVADALQSLGIKLYTDGDQDDLYTYLYGLNSSGSYTFVTGSGQTAITASQYTLSGQDEAKSVFKRLYHNLPTLLKSKGTNKFVNYLTTLYGIPDSILFPIEYGGVDKDSNTYEYNYSKFSYALQFSQSLASLHVNNTLSPKVETLEFRFKPYYTASAKQQVLYTTATGSTLQNLVTLEYFTASYNGTVNTGSTAISSSYNWGTLKYRYNSNSSTSASITLPFYETGSYNEYDWWNVIVNKIGTQITLTVKNEIYGEIGHQSTSSFTLTGIPNILPTGSILYLGKDLTTGSFYGQIQELRGWSGSLSSSVINNHTLNPESYIGNNTSSAYTNLLFRFPLGNDLITASNVIYGVQPTPTTAASMSITNTKYNSFTEDYYSLPAIGGYSTPVTNKVRIISQSLSTTQLNPFKSVVNTSITYKTLDTHLTQVGFSPQDQINNDIIAHLGNTYNLDDILGDPSNANLDTYPALNALKINYFDKYDASYNYKDFVVLIETFHKSLFRYLTDFTPARTDTVSGIIIKPHILERSKVKRHEPQVSTSSVYYGSTQMVSITGSDGSDCNCTRTNEEMFNGELSGSIIKLDSAYEQENPFTKYPIREDLEKFEMPYGGWDALNNNVSSSLISRNKFKKASVSSSISTVSNKSCIRYKVTNLGRLGGTPADQAKPAYFAYTNCNSIGTLCAIVNASPFPSYNPNSIYVEAEEDSITWTDSSFCGGGVYAASNNFQVAFDSYINKVPSTITNFTYITSSIQWQDSLETETSFIRSRKDGVKTISLNYNEPMIFGSSIGTTPNIEYTTPYMLFYDWTSNTLAERYGSNNFHIKFLIDETGSVYKPEYSSSYWYTVSQAFGSDTEVNISIYDMPVFVKSQTSEKTTVYRSLKQFETILYTDTGSHGDNYLHSGYFTTMSFVTPSNNYISNLDEDFNLSGDYNPSSAIERVKYNVVVKNPNNGWNSGNYDYTVLGTPIYLADISYHIRVDVNSNTGTSVATSVVYLTRGGRNIQLGSSFDSETVTTSGVTLSGTANNVTLLEGDKIWVQINYNNTSAGKTWNAGGFFISDDDTYLVVRDSAILNTSLTATSSFWATSSNGTVLTASNQLSSFYGGFKQNNTIEGYTLNSGFSDPQLFNIQPYDQMRFGGKEESTYIIISSSFNDPYNLNPGTRASGSGTIASMALPFTASVYYNNVTYSFIASPTLNTLPSVTTGNNQIYYFYTGSSTADSVNSLKNSINLILSGSGAYIGNIVTANTSSTQLQLTASNVGFSYNALSFLTGSSTDYNLFTLSGGTDPNPSSLCLFLDKTPQSENINYFVIRRLVDNPGFVILNTTLADGPGFIIPKYPTKTLKENLPSIIENLSRNYLIP